MKKVKNVLAQLFHFCDNRDRKDIQSEYLRRYIRKTCVSDKLKQSDLLSSNEALKHFGQMWGKYKPDTLMMLTSLEYQFIAEESFTEKELAVIKHFIGSTSLFFKNCQIEYDAQIAEQERRAKKN